MFETIFLYSKTKYCKSENSYTIVKLILFLKLGKWEKNKGKNRLTKTPYIKYNTSALLLSENDLIIDILL